VEDERIVTGKLTGELDSKLTRVNKEVEGESAKWMKYLGNRESLKNRDEQSVEQLKKLVDCEHRYRKFFQNK
jgi:hypothetical protein